MDVPTRQAYIANLVEPSERTAAAAYTNTARYVVRPLGSALGGVVQQIGLGAPFVVAGTLKTAYDLTLWSWFRRVPLEDGREVISTGTAADEKVGRAMTGEEIGSICRPRH
jgi:hypothetical protein